MGIFAFLFQITGELKFTDLPSKLSRKLTVDNVNLRKMFYVAWASTSNVQDMFSILMQRLHEFFSSHYLETDVKKLPERDILYILLECQNLKTSTTSEKIVVDVTIDEYELSKPVYVSENILQKERSHATSKLKKIGYQHVYIHRTIDSSASSEKDSRSDDDEPLAKKLKTCQLAKSVDYDNLLSRHKKNATTLTGSKTNVYILIFCDSKEKCRNIASHFGFIFLDDILRDVEINAPIEEVYQLRTANKSAKLYRLIQALFNRKLMFGFNNICLTANDNIFCNISANVKAIICYGDDPIRYIDISSHSFITVSIKNVNILEYVSAIAEIIDAALNCKSHINVQYHLRETDEFCEVKFPVMAVVPSYILRFLVQVHIGRPENMIESIFCI